MNRLSVGLFCAFVTACASHHPPDVAKASDAQICARLGYAYASGDRAAFDAAYQTLRTKSTPPEISGDACLTYMQMGTHRASQEIAERRQSSSDWAARMAQMEAMGATFRNAGSGSEKSGIHDVSGTDRFGTVAAGR